MPWYIDNQMKKKAFGKTLYEWHNASEINWDIYWGMIKTLDGYVKKNRSPNMPSRGGWNWPLINYDAPKIFRARFHKNGSTNKSYREISEQFNLCMKNADQFVAGIISTMIRVMNHPLRRRKWDKKNKFA